MSIDDLRSAGIILEGPILVKEWSSQEDRYLQVRCYENMEHEDPLVYQELIGIYTDGSVLVFEVGCPDY